MKTCADNEGQGASEALEMSGDGLTCGEGEGELKDCCLLGPSLPSEREGKGKRRRSHHRFTLCPAY